MQELPNIIVTVTQIMPDNSTTVPSYSLHIEHQHTNLHRKGIDKQYCNDYTNIYIGVDVTNSAVLWESNWFIFVIVNIYTFLSVSIGKITISDNSSYMKFIVLCVSAHIQSHHQEKDTKEKFPCRIPYVFTMFVFMLRSQLTYRKYRMNWNY